MTPTPDTLREALEDPRPCAYVYEGQRGVGGIPNPRCLMPWDDGIHTESPWHSGDESGHPYTPLERRATLQRRAALQGDADAPLTGNHLAIAVVERLGFDPTNHHNAARCPYCSGDADAPVGGLPIYCTGGCDACRDYARELGVPLIVLPPRAAATSSADAGAGGLATEDEPMPGNLFGEQSRQWLVDRHGEATVMDFEYAFWRASKRSRAFPARLQAADEGGE